MTSFKSIGWRVVLGALLSQGALSAQEAPPQGDLRHGGFGAPVVKFTEIDNRFGVLVGGRGGWIINDSFVLGGGGYGLVNGSNFKDVTNALGDRGKLAMGYGGLELEYVLQPRDVVHLSMVVLVGAGGLVWDPEGQGGTRDDDAFFITEPALNVLVNVTRHFRIGLGASYRFAQGVKLVNLRSADVSGFAGVVTLKFGSF